MCRKLERVLILGLTMVALNGNAYSTSDSKDILTQKCHSLAQTVATLVSSQGKKACAEKLVQASLQLSTAGDFIGGNIYNNAKKELDGAIYTLQYAELNNCNKYIQISHSKLEAKKLKNSLLDNR